MKNIFVLTISLVTLLLIGCTSTNILVINVEKPAEVTLPSNIHNIVVVNNSVQQAEEVGHKAFLKAKEINKPIRVSTDSIDIILMEGIYAKIVDKNYFENVVLYPNPTRIDNNYDQDIDLSSERVSQIAEETNSEAVITIDKVTLLTKTDSQPSDEFLDATLNFLDLDMAVTFRVYSAEGKLMSSPFLISDSIFWTETRYGKEVLTDSLPSRENALKAGASYLSEKISTVFTPYWSNETRIYYGDAKDASNKMDKNEWVAARSIWENEFNKETKSKRKARLANNIALTYELTDDLKEAARWAQVSCDLFSEEQLTSVDKDYLTKAVIYKETLINRINDFRILDIRK